MRNITAIKSFIFVVTMMQLSSKACHARNKTAIDLYQDLFKSYVKGVRPVMDIKTTTNVTYRVAFRSLLNFDTRGQTITLGAFLKATWKDDFLRWKHEEYSGITVLHAPIASIWIPDITLNDNADTLFERFKPDTRAHIYSDGTIIWYTPVIYTAACSIRVRWFPFDTQVCDMIFLSWSYDGLGINLEAERTVDASQDWYKANGVWDMIVVRPKRVVTKYLCCPEPYPEIHYRLVFKRHATFYINYMVLPCLFLSALSLLVFNLPPDCGEKLTLSITNLLALVVFQQIIAENMPPSSGDSPVIGTYFICMIAMVCISVILTGVVMHVSAISHPMPKWVKRIFLELAPKFICLSAFPSQNRVATTNIVKRHINEDLNTNGNVIIDNGKIDDGKTNCNSVEHEQDMVNEIKELLDYMKKDIQIKNGEISEHLQWRRVSIVIDRMLLYIFSVFTVVCTCYLSVILVQGSINEYNDILNELEVDW